MPVKRKERLILLAIFILFLRYSCYLADTIKWERASFGPFHSRTFLISSNGISLITGLIIVTPKLKLKKEFYSSMV